MRNSHTAACNDTVNGAASLPDASGFLAHPLRDTPPLREVLVVATLDGNIHGMQPDTGRLLWTFASGSPLVSSRRADATSSARPGGGSHDVNIFPGADGGLYAYHGVQAGSLGLEVSSPIQKQHSS